MSWSEVQAYRDELAVQVCLCALAVLSLHLLVLTVFDSKRAHKSTN